MKKVSKSLSSIANKITERDAQALKSIYDLRCLTGSQIYQLHYSVNVRTNKPVADTFCKSKINIFLDLGLIEGTSFYLNGKNDTAYFLTSLGVDLIRVHFNLAHNIFDTSRKVISRGYLRPSELKINSRLIPHQIYLNQFYIDFTKLNLNFHYTYQDAKHATKFFDVAPDGILTAKDTYYFLEMDLGTESRKLLTEKWQHYKAFLNSESFLFIERKVVVLFILENISDIEQRRNLVKLTAYEELREKLGYSFDIYVGSRNYILNCLSNKLLPNSIESSPLPLKNISDILSNYHGISCRPAAYASEITLDSKSFTYLSKLEEGTSLDFLLICDHYYDPISTFSKIYYFERTKDLFYNKISKAINFLIIVESIENLYNDLKLTNLTYINIFFSTVERLENLPFEQALFQLDTQGNLYTFNHTLNERIFSHNILQK